MQALSAQQASAEELAAIKLMLDEIAAEKVNQ
jgi:hypothetical protein